MGNVNVELYKNTGFDARNIPDSIALVRAMQSIPVRGIASRSSLRASIKVEIDPSEAAQVDYCVLDGGNMNTYCYFVTEFRMLSPKTCELVLLLDALTTTGAIAPGSNAVDGWLTRKNKPLSQTQNIDEAVKLTLNEPWQPSDELEDDYDNNIVGALSGGIRSYVHSVIDLEDAEPKARDYSDPKTGSFVTVPELNKVTNKTAFAIDGFGSTAGVGTSQEGLGIYQATENDTVIKTIARMWSLGMDTIKDSYVLPIKYGAPFNSEGGFVLRMTSSVNTVSTSINLIPEGYTPENYKAALLHQRIKLMSTASGSEATYSVSQLGGDLSFKYWANPMPNGNPFCRPATIKGSDNLLYGAVAGAKWQKAPFATSLAQGSALAFKDYRRDEINNGLNFAVNTATGGIIGRPKYETVSDATTRAGRMAAKEGLNTSSFDTIMSGVNYASDFMSRSVAFDRQMNLTPPELQFERDQEMQNFTGNDFTVVRTRLSINDIRRFDEFLHRYGEAVDEEFTNEDVHTMSKFNYVQAERVFIDTPFPNYVRNAAVSQLEGGVRVWHVRPNQAALKLGGN